ncbi:MAG: hypothetical protein AAF740_02825 [Bacteroidota bacterium]
MNVVSRTYAKFFLFLAVAGFIMSLFFHITAILGVETVFHDAAFVSHIAIFPIAYFAIRYCNSMEKSDDNLAFWRFLFKNAPTWLSFLFCASMVYILFNAFIASESEELSELWMFFYLFPSIVFYIYLFPKKQVVNEAIKE